MADGPVYRAVFLRMHPTGKAVLSLSEASQGQEASLAETAGAELGIPPEDVKVVHQDTNRFGQGNSFNSAPSDAVGENVAITARKLRDRAQLIAAWMLEAAPDTMEWDENGHWSAGGESVSIQAVARRAFGGDSLPDGIEGSLDAQTAYRLDAPQPAG
ncbi:MAG TPA: molybdopterin cofactor-binding domain-containing protein [Solirubrobacterales bacterium]|nr:molybdopterin cofactor-binding domain-containing protein [Solirubrobacterales bacterium]